MIPGLIYNILERIHPVGTDIQPGLNYAVNFLFLLVF